MFWVIAALLILLGLAFVLLPMLSSYKSLAKTSRTDVNRSIYHAKVEELKADLKSGLLEENEYQNALNDLQQTLLSDAESDNDKPVVSKKGLVGVVSVAVLLPLASIFLYLNISTNPTPDQIAQHQDFLAQADSIETSIAKLKTRLQQNPNDFDGWMMLGQSYFVMRDFQSARDAYLQASELSSNADPDVLVYIAEASSYSNGEQFSAYEKDLLSRALRIDPQNERALWYSGYAEYVDLNYDEAVKYWSELVKYVPADRPDVKQTLTQFLNDAREKAGMPVLAEANLGDVTNDQDIELVGDLVEDSARTIEVKVDIDEALKVKTQPNDTLFVYARPANGPRMPLSLARFTTSNLPITVTLSKDMAMMPNMDIDTMEQVEVLARVSKSGQAITQSGDLISQVTLVNFRQSPNHKVSLTINSVVE